jgi:hypothetical protein
VKSEVGGQSTALAARPAVRNPPSLYISVSSLVVIVGIANFLLH